MDLRLGHARITVALSWGRKRRLFRGPHPPHTRCHGPVLTSLGPGLSHAHCVSGSVFLDAIL